MSDLIKKSYSDARYEATSTVMGYVEELVSSISYFGKKIKSDTLPLNLFITAHDERLSYKALLAGTSSSHGLAYLEHYGDLLERVKGIFVQVGAEADRVGDRELLRELGNARHVEQMYENDYMPEVGEFFTRYAVDITAEKKSESYSRDKKVIDELRSELQQVMKSGQWTPETITVTDRNGKHPRQVETPSSHLLGRMANMAPRLAQLGF